MINHFCHILFSGMSANTETDNSKRPYRVNYELCIICQQINKKKSVVKNPSRESIDKLLEICKIRDTYRDGTVLELKNILSSIPREKHYSLVYHRECYSSLTNKKKIEQVIKKFETSKSPTESSSKVGRPRKEDSEKQPTTRRRSEILYHKEKCIICQENRN